ncbi:MAG: TlpA family protein disulfide reductase [Burkholderiales bacterium]|nr:MAG: TlpA family protein disulfide reductase [Burkholderiales bacterium]
MNKSFYALLLALSLLLVSEFSQAQPALPKNAQILGKTMDGQPFDLAKLKGKVVLVMFWATDCAVCRDKMHELRDNAKGWQGKPFTTVLISADRRASDVDSYNAIINASVPKGERLTQLWAYEPSYRDSLGTTEVMRSRTATTLPLTLVIDKKGDVVKRYQGRIPAEVWDDISELL